MVGCAKLVAVRQGIGLIGGALPCIDEEDSPSLPAADQSRRAKSIWPVIAWAGEQEAAEQLSAKVLLMASCRDGTPTVPVICLSAVCRHPSELRRAWQSLRSIWCWTARRTLERALSGMNVQAGYTLWTSTSSRSMYTPPVPREQTSTSPSAPQ